MNPVKIIHCADMHLDAPFSGLSDNDAEIRQEDVRETFNKIIKMANEEKVDALLMSGDIFDRETVKKTTIDYIIKKFEECQNITIAIIAGNHDCLAKNYFYNNVVWPKNVHVFNEKISKLEIPEKNLCIYGASFLKNYQEEGVYKDFTVEDESKINIVLVHGEMTSKGSKSNYNPISVDDIKNMKADYVALGHIHTFSGVNKVDNTYWAYPGTPEGKGFDETGEKGILLGHIGKTYNDLKFVPTNKREYIELNINVSDTATHEEISLNVKEKINSDSLNNLYKIVLTGEIEEGFSLNTDIIKNQLIEDTFFVKVKNATKYKIDYSTIDNEDTLKNAFIKQLMEEIGNTMDTTAKETVKNSLELGIKALNGEGIDLDEDK